MNFLIKNKKVKKNVILVKNYEKIRKQVTVRPKYFQKKSKKVKKSEKIEKKVRNIFKILTKQVKNQNFEKRGKI